MGCVERFLTALNVNEICVQTRGAILGRSTGGYGRLWKVTTLLLRYYLDDTTVSENIPKGQQSKSQEAVDAIYDWSKENLFQLNGEKTKELVISFSRDSPQLPGICIDGTPIKTIQSTKLLGLTIIRDLKQ